MKKSSKKDDLILDFKTTFSHMPKINFLSYKESRNYSKAKGDSAIIRTMDKIPMYIKYIEREYKIQVLDKTKAKNIRYMSTKKATNIAWKNIFKEKKIVWIEWLR